MIGMYSDFVHLSKNAWLSKPDRNQTTRQQFLTLIVLQSKNTFESFGTMWRRAEHIHICSIEEAEDETQARLILTG